MTEIIEGVEIIDVDEPVPNNLQCRTVITFRPNTGCGDSLAVSAFDADKNRWVGIASLQPGQAVAVNGFNYGTSVWEQIFKLEARNGFTGYVKAYNPFIGAPGFKYSYDGDWSQSTVREYHLSEGESGHIGDDRHPSIDIHRDNDTNYKELKATVRSA